MYCPITGETQAVKGYLTNAVYGKIHWMRFVDASLSKEDAKKEAVRLVLAQSKGEDTLECQAE